MKTFVRHAVALLAITAVCQASRALAEEYYWTSGGNQSASLTGEQKSATQENMGCGNCCDPTCCDESCCDDCGVMGCEACPAWGIVGFAGLDSFKGVGDGSFESNFGAVTGFNAAVPFPGLRDRGFGWQLGMSYGVYDLDGWGSADVNSATSQQQIFVTTGFYRKAQGDQRLSFGLVYDWMFNDTWGVYGVNPTLGQWRGQVEYALSGRNGVGVWACQRDLGAINRFDQNTLVGTRAISQASFFWHHKFESGADSYLYVGIPDHGRLSGDGSLLDWTIGASVVAPLSDRLALYANGSYARPSAAAGANAAMESAYDVSMGVMWYFGGHARSKAINGKCGLPYMPLANNSNFLVDQHPTY